MEDKQIKQEGVISDAEFQKLKVKHKDVFILTVLFNENPDDEKSEEVELIAYLRKPKRYEMGMSLAIMDSNPVKAKELILEKTWLAGDVRIKENDDAFYSAIVSLDSFIIVRESGLKKN